MPSPKQKCDIILPMNIIKDMFVLQRKLIVGYKAELQCIGSY